MTVVPESEEPELSETERAVLDVLERHQGRDDPITASEVAQEVGITDGEASPQTRRVITDLIDTGRVAIGSCSRGFFLIQTREELTDYLQHLDTRIRGIEQRKEALVRAFERDSDQTRLGEVATDGGAA